MHSSLNYRDWTDVCNMQAKLSSSSEVVTGVINPYIRPAISKFLSHFKDAPHMLLGIDECQTLTVRQPSAEGSDAYTMYDALCTVLHDLENAGIFVIFISTKSHAFYRSPDVGEQRAGRWSSKEASLHLKEHAPSTTFPFDVYDGGPIITEGEMTLKDVCEVAFLCRFGRPL